MGRQTRNAAAEDVASQTGGAISQNLAYSNITGRPGFAGIFVENDQ